MRRALAVIAGYVLWSVLWLTCNMGLQKAGLLPADVTQPVQTVGPLLALLIGSIVISLIAGYVTALINRSAASGVIAALGVLLLATGIFFEIQNWTLLPVWYHLTFLVLLVPICFVGARFYGGAAAVR